MSKYIYYIFNKPYNVLCQFTKEIPQHVTLQDYLILPKDVYPVGRLDKDSEGLLLLTNDNQLKNKLLDPGSKSSKTYMVQVDGEISKDAITKLRSGVRIKLKKGYYITKSCDVSKIDPPDIKKRNPPIRVRPSIPTSWIEITIEEGKNRQIRKMCAAIDFPCLRLIRSKIRSESFIDVRLGNGRNLKPEEISNLKK